MKNQNLFENIIVDEKLTDNDHLRWLIKLRRINSLSGIESICLSKASLKYNITYIVTDTTL